MLLRYFIRLCFCLLLTSGTLLLYAHQEIKFIENKGQWDDHILFRADLAGGKLFVEKDRLTYMFFDNQQLADLHHEKRIGEVDFHAAEVVFLGSNTTTHIITERASYEYYNFFIGTDKSRWASGVRGYGKITIKDIYQGTDLVLEGIDQVIKYTFVLSRYGNPDEIKMQYNGFNKVYLRNGELHLLTNINKMIEHIPEVYQISEAGKIPVECRFRLKKNILGFSFPAGFDFNLPLVIDPVVIFSSYSGSYADNFGYTATYDDSGYAYSGGTVFGLGYPATLGAYQITFAGGHPGTVTGSGNARDVGILKYEPDGRKLVYASYLGGRGNEDPHSLVVDKNFNLFIFGNTSSENFPIGARFYDSSYNGNFDIFLAKLSPDGRQLLASTFIGGSGEDGLNGYYNPPGTGNNLSELGFNYGDSYRGEINVDKNNNVFVATTTKSSNFPVTTGVFQPAYGGGVQDACVFKMSNSLDTLLHSSFIGGSSDDAGYGIAFHSDGSFYVCGGTRSTNLPVTTGKYQTTYQGGVADGFIYHVSSDFSTIRAATYFGTASYDQVYLIQTDKKDNVYVTGQTMSNSFPVRNVNYSNPLGKMFISKLNSGLDSLIYSTVFGSGRPFPDLSPSAFMVDRCERVYFSGWGGGANFRSRNTGSSTYNLAVTNDAFQKTTDGSDFYIAVFSKDIQSLLFATYWGGNISDDHVDGGTSRFDKQGVVYQSVCASCGGVNDFPTYPSDVHSSTNNASNCNNAIVKIQLYIPDLLANFMVDTIFCLADSTHIMNLSVGAETYRWNFGDPNNPNDTSSKFEPRYSYADTGVYLIRLIASNINSCDLHDTAYQHILIYNQSESDFTWQPMHCVNHISFSGTSRYAQSFYWHFGDSNNAVNSSYLKNPEHIYSDTGRYTVTLIVDSGTVCQHITVKEIHIPHIPHALFEMELDTCDGMVLLRNLSSDSKTYLWDYGNSDTSNYDSFLHRYYYDYADSFVITLVAEPYQVCADTFRLPVNIITPKAKVILDIDTCQWTVSFMNPSTYASKASLWNFGDGHDSSFIDTILNYVYEQSGQYRVRLIANIGTLCIDTVYKDFELPELPEASFSYLRTDCEPYVFFSNNSSNAAKSFWDFDNGLTSEADDTINVFYSEAGEYLIRLTVTSNENCIDSFSDTVKIDHLALANFHLDWDTCTNKITVTNNSTQSGQYYWKFGDGKTSNDTSRIFIHHFDNSGIPTDTGMLYTVLLIVIDPPCSDTMIKQILVHVPPPIDFKVEYDSCFPIASFSSSSKGALNFFWEFGDGDTSTKKDVIHEYPDEGEYRVRFYINLNEICTDSVEHFIRVNKYKPEEIIIPNIFTPNNDLMNDQFSLKGLNLSCDNYELIIFNRWGQELFRSNSDLFWDGRVNGKTVSEGTYYYVFKSNYFSTAGTITVIY